MNTTDGTLLDIKELTVSFTTENQPIEVVHRISFTIKKNEILGIVGESGSGKSVTSLALLGLLSQKTAKVEWTNFNFDGKIINTNDHRAFDPLRGKEIAMIFQEPMSSLNPSKRCGYQVTEMLLKHRTDSAKSARIQTLELFKKVKLSEPERIFAAYPHELSGGQKQRIMIAMAISCKPKLLIADEPTTALDVTVQKEILKLLKELQQETGMSILFISHDLALVSELADHILVMYKGDVVEYGSTATIFKNPTATYTKALLNSRPSLQVRLKRLPTIQDFLAKNPLSGEVNSLARKSAHQELYARPPILEVRNVRKTFVSGLGMFRKRSFHAVDDVSFQLYEGETLGLVGESGCGKSTLGNAILQLDKATAGSIRYRGKDITKLKGSALRKLRKEIQLIFQDPFASLNPTLSVGQAIMEPIWVHKLFPTKKQCKVKALELLKQVGMEPEHYDRYPHEFSGGQRQRIGIARTIALQPKLIICDESVSALDISVQAQVLNLLNELKENFGFTYIFISHDLAVVKYMSDQLVVMNRGKIEEIGDADQIYADPKSSYTQKLIKAIPKGL